MNARLCTILLFSFIGFTLNAQIAPLNAGDKIPQIAVNTIFPQPSPHIAPLSFNGKPVLFDFGGLNCGGCVHALPRLSKLAKLFSDSVVIVWVTKDDSASLFKFLVHAKNGATVGIPIIASDSLLERLFPHRSVPYEVWVDKNGVVKAFSDAQYIDSFHLHQLLYDKPNDWPMEREVGFNLAGEFVQLNSDLLSFDTAKSYLHTFFSNHIPGLPQTFHERIDSSAGTITYEYVNQPILELYFQQFYDEIRYRYEGGPVFYDIRVRNPGRITHDSDIYFRTQWLHRNSYCFEASFPISIPLEERRKRMTAMLNSYLNLYGRVIEREQFCWIVKSIAKKQRLTSVSSKANIGNGNIDASTVADLVDRANALKGHPLMIDETVKMGQPSLQINLHVSKTELYSLASMRNVLRPFGLTIAEEPRKVKIFKLTDL